MSLSLYKNLDMYTNNWLVKTYNLPPPPDIFYTFDNIYYSGTSKKISTTPPATPANAVNNAAKNAAKDAAKDTAKKAADAAAAASKNKYLKEALDKNVKFLVQLNKRGEEIKKDTTITEEAKKKYFSDLKLIFDETILKSKKLEKEIK